MKTRWLTLPVMVIMLCVAMVASENLLATRGATGFGINFSVSYISSKPTMELLRQYNLVEGGFRRSIRRYLNQKFDDVVVYQQTRQDESFAGCALFSTSDRADTLFSKLIGIRDLFVQPEGLEISVEQISSCD